MEATALHPLGKKREDSRQKRSQMEEGRGKMEATAKIQNGFADDR